MNVHEDIMVSNNGVEAGGAGGQVPEELVGPGGAAAELAAVAELATVEAAGGTAVGACGHGEVGVGTKGKGGASIQKQARVCVVFVME